MFLISFYNFFNNCEKRSDRYSIICKNIPEYVINRNIVILIIGPLLVKKVLRPVSRLAVKVMR